MATITVTEILGTDNIAGSRITINSNFSALAAGINNLEQRLDTSYTPGGALNVGSVIIYKYTNPVTTQIFSCEASGLVSGNFNVGKSLGVTESLTVSQNVTAGGNVNFNGSYGSGKQVINSNVTVFQNSAGQAQSNLWGSGTGVVVNPQSLPIVGVGYTSRALITANFPYLSAIQLDFSTYSPGTTATSCSVVTLPAVTGANVAQGQILTFFISDLPAAGVTSGEFRIRGNFHEGIDNVLLNDGLNSDNTDIYQSAVTLFASQNGWRVLSTAGPVAISSTLPTQI